MTIMTITEFTNYMKLIREEYELKELYLSKFPAGHKEEIFQKLCKLNILKSVYYNKFDSDSNLQASFESLLKLMDYNTEVNGHNYEKFVQKISNILNLFRAYKNMEIGEEVCIELMNIYSSCYRSSNFAKFLYEMQLNCYGALYSINLRNIHYNTMLHPVDLELKYYNEYHNTSIKSDKLLNVKGELDKIYLNANGKYLEDEEIELILKNIKNITEEEKGIAKRLLRGENLISVKEKFEPKPIKELKLDTILGTINLP